jgi:hypothetical protein
MGSRSNMKGGNGCSRLKGLHNHPRAFAEATRTTVTMLRIASGRPMRVKMASLDQPEVELVD